MELFDLIEAIEHALDKKALKKMLPLQPGDVPDTFADSSKLAKNLGYLHLKRKLTGLSLGEFQRLRLANIFCQKSFQSMFSG